MNTETATTPKVTNIKRHQGIAGQFSYTATVQYPGEDPSKAEFVGYADSSTIILVMANGTQVYVRRPDRFGYELNPSWVRRFFGAEETP